MKWISVNDRVPDLIENKKGNPCSKQVLTTDGFHIQVGSRWICGNESYFLPDYREDFQRITHWMPLPEPPKEKDE